LAVSRGLLVETDDVSGRVAKPGRYFGRVRADWLDELPTVRFHGVDRRRHAVNHDVKQQAGLPGWRPTRDPRATHLAGAVVEVPVAGLRGESGVWRFRAAGQFQRKSA